MQAIEPSVKDFTSTVQLIELVSGILHSLIVHHVVLVKAWHCLREHAVAVLVTDCN